MIAFLRSFVFAFGTAACLTLTTSPAAYAQSAAPASAPATASNEAPLVMPTPEQNVQMAENFMKIYTNLCVANIPQLDALRAQLQNLPALETEKAAYFLQGYAGKAWPVTGVNGSYVVAIPDQINFCAVYVLRADVAKMQELFQKFATQPPADMTAKEEEARRTESAGTSVLHQNYSWTYQGASNRVLLILSTSTYPDGGTPQGMASISIISD